jgi:hypothetical protein
MNSATVVHSAHGAHISFGDLRDHNSLFSLYAYYVRYYTFFFNPNLLYNSEDCLFWHGTRISKEGQPVFAVVRTGSTPSPSTGIMVTPLSLRVYFLCVAGRPAAASVVFILYSGSSCSFNKLRNYFIAHIN